MNDERFLRKAKTAPIFADPEDSELLALLRDMFIEHRAPYCVKELAAARGVSVFTIYRMFSGERSLPADTLLFIVAFVASKDKRDFRLLNFINEHGDCIAVPKVSPAHDDVLQKIMGELADLTKGEK